MRARPLCVRMQGCDGVKAALSTRAWDIGIKRKRENLLNLRLPGQPRPVLVVCGRAKDRTVHRGCSCPTSACRCSIHGGLALIWRLLALPCPTFQFLLCGYSPQSHESYPCWYSPWRALLSSSCFKQHPIPDCRTPQLFTFIFSVSLVLPVVNGLASTEPVLQLDRGRRDVPGDSDYSTSEEGKHPCFSVPSKWIQAT